MSVYFAQVGRYIKVGYSENPERRVANLFKSATRYSAPRDISAQTPRTLLAAVDGTKDDESRAHIALNDFRVSTEWFIDEPELREFMAECVALNAIPRDRRVTRPAGDFHWQDDPILWTDEDREWDRRAAMAVSAAMSRAMTP